MAGSRTGGAVPFPPQFRVVASGINRSFETYIYDTRDYVRMCKTRRKMENGEHRVGSLIHFL